MRRWRTLVFCGALGTAVAMAFGRTQTFAPDVATQPGGFATQEKLDRGLVALRTDASSAIVSFRALVGDPKDTSFELWRRDSAIGTWTKRAAIAPGAATFVTDTDVPGGDSVAYRLRTISPGKQPIDSAPFVLKNAAAEPFLTIPLDTPDGYAPNDASVGDLDGDGALEIVLHQAGRGKDNSQNGETDPPILQAYTLAGKKLWQINLGKNIREGAHYTQFLVADFDGDGRAEVACKTADGTIDGVGKVIGDAGANFVNAGGRILRGPEFLTVFDGETGAAIDTIPYVPARGEVASWGDNYGNRSDRFLAATASLDGKTTSMVFCRGYYTRTVLAAFDLKAGKLTPRWVFDTSDPAQKIAEYAGQGNHNLRVGDVDGDGRDEIVYGAMCVDDDGRGLYNTKLGHGDAIHLSDLDPTRPGLEVFDIHEHNNHENGAEMRDARTGALLWGKKSPDVGRGVAFDIDPRHPGYETWASGDGLSGLWSARGETISEKKPRSCNFGVWWDGDLSRELLDKNQITKWRPETSSETLLLDAVGCVSNNGTKATPVLCADILGDWREEVILRATDNRSLRIYVSPIPTKLRMPTLLHDRTYRHSVANQNIGYNQPTQPGFYLGTQ